jgi:flagellar hook assembly protein FlgD
MIKKIIAGLSVLFMLFSLIACAGVNTETTSPSPSFSLTSTLPTPNPTVTPAPEPGININRTSDVIVAYGEIAEITFSFTNQASKTLTIAPFPPEIKIIKLPEVKPPILVVRYFLEGNSDQLVQPGESYTRTIYWDQKNHSGEQVPPGWYGVEVTTSTGRGLGQSVLVLPPEGVMGKAIEVNQSRTVNGITFNLERVVLNQKGMNIYAFNTPPDYNLPQGSQLPPPQFMSLHAEAEYSIDNGVIKQTYPSSIDFKDSGMEHVWYQYLDPVPQNSHKLTFRITRLGDWEGPWEFEVSLESGVPFTSGMNTDKKSYLPGEQVTYGSSITNLSSGTMTIDPFPPARQIKSLDQDKVVISEPAGTRTWEIMPAPFYHNTGSWDQRDSNGDQVPPGLYEIAFEYILIEQNTSKSYPLNLEYEFQIVSPESALNKSLEINQSITAEELTITLERLELNAAGGKAFIFFIPPGYTMSEDHPPRELSESLFNSIAEYSLDGGVGRTALNSESEFNQSGARLIWNLDPVPVGSQELVFTVDHLGNWNGPWIFKVKLD